MVGFFKRLVGSRQTADTEATGGSATAPAAPQKGEAFFLDPDEALTLGNVEYMRTSKTVRHTFPNTKNPGTPLEFVQEVSAKGNKVIVGEKGESSLGSTAASSTSSGSAAAQPQKKEATRRQKADYGMDMFRNMARDIGKK
jgi:hypothetical protein